MKKLLTTLAITFALAMPANAMNVQNSVAALSAFKCSAWASMLSNSGESKRLFDYGVMAGMKFLVDWQENRLPPEEANTVTVDWLTTLLGPTLDFRLGQVYSNTARQAYDEVRRVDAQGIVSSNSSTWSFDEAVYKTRALNKYNDSNCKLIGMGQ